MGGRALIACEEDVGGWTLDAVFNDELYSRADPEEAGGWTMVDVVAGEPESRADRKVQRGWTSEFDMAKRPGLWAGVKRRAGGR
jgi:hypothetical protein